MVVQGVKCEKEEILDLRGVLPATPAAALLAKIVMRLEKEGHDALRDRGAGLEALRYAQGFLDALGRFEAIAQAMLVVDLERPEEDDAEDAVEEAVDVDF
jgi:hypothetical protein